MTADYLFRPIAVTRTTVRMKILFSKLGETSNVTFVLTLNSVDIRAYLDWIKHGTYKKNREGIRIGRVLSMSIPTMVGIACLLQLGNMLQLLDFCYGCSVLPLHFLFMKAKVPHRR